MTACEYQVSLLPRCRRKFRRLEVTSEWPAFSGIMHQYSPRVDIAIGPYNIGPGPNLMTAYDRLLRTLQIRNFVTAAFEIHQENLNVHTYGEIQHPTIDQLLRLNRNSRCLFAIEIENTNSKKHMMGSIINAASLGRIGIGVAYCDAALRTFLRILNYLAFLKSVGKNTYNTNNFLVLSSTQFSRLLRAR